jgi:hypothetical protein
MQPRNPMNWKLILSLSLFGLVMSVGTVYFISSMAEPVFWLVIFIISAAAIAKYATGRFFVHGLCVGLANCIWMTGGHVLLFDDYAARHAGEMERMAGLPFSPRVMMLIVGPAIGAASGAMLGLLSLIVARVFLRKGD